MPVAGTIAEKGRASCAWSPFYRGPPIALLLIAVVAVGPVCSTRSGPGGAGAALPRSPLLVQAGPCFRVPHHGRETYRASKMLSSRRRHTPERAGIRIDSDGEERPC